MNWSFKVSSINIQWSVRSFRPQQICIQEVFELRLLNAQIIYFLQPCVYLLQFPIEQYHNVIKSRHRHSTPSYTHLDGQLRSYTELVKVSLLKYPVLKIWADIYHLCFMLCLLSHPLIYRTIKVFLELRTQP